MQNAVEHRYTALPFRDHTILGVCEAIGEDFGFNPIWLRVPLAASVLLSVKYAIAAYLLLGVIALGSRLLFPHHAKVATEAPTDAMVDAGTDEEQQLPLAA